MEFVGLCLLTCGLGNLDILQIIALVSEHLPKIRHSSSVILAMLVWLGMNNICSLQLSAFNSLDKVVAFSAILNTKIIMIFKTLYYSVMFHAEDSTLSQSHPFFSPSP